MSQSRPELQNPLHSLIKTAFDLALYLRHVSKDEFITVITPVRDQYAGPLESYVWSSVYYFIRTRLERLDLMIARINEYNGDDVGKLILDEVSDILRDTKGGWEDTSVNTTMLQTFIKQIHNYDSEKSLTAQETHEFNALLLAAIENRLEAENKLSQEESRLKEIEEEKLRLECEVIKKQEELLRKKEEILEKEDKLETLQIEHDVSLKQIENERAQKVIELLGYQKQLEEIDREQKQRREELELARKTLLLLNPDIDIHKMGFNEIEAIMTEATLVAKAAIKTYIHERNEILRQQEERKKLRGNVTAAKQNLSGQQLGGVHVATDEAANQEKAKMDEASKQRRLEIEQVCGQRATKGSDEDVKAYLKNFFSVRIKKNSRVEAEKKEEEKRIIEERGSLARLYSEGVRTRIINPEAMAAISKPPVQKRQVRKPVSSNAEFMAAFEHLNNTYKPQTSSNPVATASVTSKKESELSESMTQATASTTLDSVAIQQDYMDDALENINQHVLKPASPRVSQPGVIPPPPPLPPASFLRQQRLFRPIEVAPTSPVTTQKSQVEAEACEIIEGMRV